MSDYDIGSLHGDMLITKKLTETDITGNMVYLPKSDVMSIVPKIPTSGNLEVGIEVRVHDPVENRLHALLLKTMGKSKCIFGSGWPDFKRELGFKEGDDLNLFWDSDKNMFILFR